MRYFLAGAAVLLSAASAAGQTMQDAVRQLYSFGTGCSQQICLSVDGTHQLHFNPAAGGAENGMTVFLQQAIGASASNIPIAAATSTGVLIQSGEGLPTRETTSPGPIFAERMQTLGKGGLYFAVNMTNFNYASLRGVPLSGLHTNITHQDVAPIGLGNPGFENDVISVNTTMHIDMLAATPNFTYGVTDKIDVGLAVPLLYTSLTGTSQAQIQPFGPNDPHYFGDSTHRSLTATSAASQTAFGIGDIAMRVKVNLHAEKTWGFAVLADVRAPTGDAKNFQGAGVWGFEILGIGSATFGPFSPHANLGYQGHDGTTQSDFALATLGFDQRMNDLATLVVDFISQWQVGSSPYQLPPNVTVTSFNTGGIPNTQRTIVPTNIPNERDNVVIASVGAKFLQKNGVTWVANALIPIISGGVQPNAALTFGVEYTR